MSCVKVLMTGGSSVSSPYSSTPPLAMPFDQFELVRLVLEEVRGLRRRHLAVLEGLLPRMIWRIRFFDASPGPRA